MHSGIGIDIFGRPDSSRPEAMQEITKAAYRAGADGILISREYDEMRIPSLKAVGGAVGQLNS